MNKEKEESDKWTLGCKAALGKEAYGVEERRAIGQNEQVGW
jgi:hypothetical protein